MRACSRLQQHRARHNSSLVTRHIWAINEPTIWRLPVARFVSGSSLALL